VILRLWLLLGLVLAWPAAAQIAPLVQDDLADLRLNDITGLQWITVARGDLATRFCDPHGVALALMTRGLSRHERDTCGSVGTGRLVTMLIGRRAVLAMTIGGRFGLTPELLYRALAREVAGADGRLAVNTVMRWHELDPALPDAAIRILLPPVGSAEDRIVSDITLYEGCSAVAGRALPRDNVRRQALCTTLRGDAVVTRAANTVSTYAWLRSQGPAAVALIGISTLLAEPELETALPLDGVTPSFTTIADGSYRAVLPVWLLAVVSSDNARAIAGIAGPLLSESAIGPLGRLPHRGLAPLAAVERVKLRATLGQEFERAAN
jgi:phosphate transport system substrate-binding protein